MEELGAPTSEVLHSKFKKYWEVDTEKQLSLLTDEYRIPQNCVGELSVPQINTEVYRKINPYVKRQDGYIKAVQTHMSKSSVAMLKITEEVLQAEENAVPIDGSVILKHALNSFSLMGHSKRFLTKHRRHVMCITKNFPSVLKEVCNGDIPDDSSCIFGDDIQKSLRDAQERVKLDLELNGSNSSFRGRGGGSNRYNRRSRQLGAQSTSSTIISASATPQQGYKKQDFRRGPAPRARKKVHFPSYNKN